MAIESFAGLDDRELLAQLSIGNRRAFDSLYDKYWRQVFNHAYKRLGNESDAQDIAQDVFVQLWSRGSQTVIENLPAYLYIAVRNGVFKYLEKEKKYDSLSDAALEIENLHHRADSNVLYSEFIRSFNKLVDNLPTQQRIIFKMRFEEGFTTDEIATELQLSVKTVRNHLGRALASLKEVLISLSIIIFLFRN